MINKNSMIFPSDSDEIKLTISKACDLYTKALFSHRPFFTKFLTPLESREVYSRFPKGEISVNTYGGYPDAERVIISFDEYGEDLPYPIKVISVKTKREASLSHRDYLGTILSLGIKRELVGDILVTDDGATVFCLEEIAGYICDNLIKIANTGVVATICEDFVPEETSRRYEKTSATVSSLRLDCVVSACVSKSRSGASELISRGLVSVNYKETASVSVGIKDGDVITVKGFGKFLINTDGNLTRKGRIHIDINKYA